MSTQRDGNHSSKLLDTEESLNPISNPRGSLLEAMVPTPQVLFTLRLLMGKFVRENAVPPPWPTSAMGKHFFFRCCSVAQSWPTLCDPMDCSTPGLAVHHQLLESAQTRVH